MKLKEDEKDPKNFFGKGFLVIGIFLVIYTFILNGLIKDDPNWVNAGATLALIAITGYYAYKTNDVQKKMEGIAKNQLLLSEMPVIVIQNFYARIPDMVDEFRSVFNIENIGNYPAIEIVIDSEVKLPKGCIKGENIIPAQSKPELIPYLKPNESISKDKPTCYQQSYGTQLINQLCIDYNFIDIVENDSEFITNSIENGSTNKCSSEIITTITVYVYYRNAFSQYFQSKYTYYFEINSTQILSRQEECYGLIITRSESIAPDFKSDKISKEEMENEINDRNKRREKIWGN